MFITSYIAIISIEFKFIDNQLFSNAFFHKCEQTVHKIKTFDMRPVFAISLRNTFDITFFDIMQYFIVMKIAEKYFLNVCDRRVGPVI